jgi:hypothetical protein
VVSSVGPRQPFGGKRIGLPRFIGPRSIIRFLDRQLGSHSDDASLLSMTAAEPVRIVFRRGKLDADHPPQGQSSTPKRRRSTSAARASLSSQATSLSANTAHQRPHHLGPHSPRDRHPSRLGWLEQGPGRQRAPLTGHERFPFGRTPDANRNRIARALTEINSPSRRIGAVRNDRAGYAKRARLFCGCPRPPHHRARRVT